MFIMKRTLSILLFVTISLALFSQTTKFGVFIDPQFTWLSAESRSVDSDGMKFGIRGGLLLDKYFQKNYAIHTGLSLGTQGGSLKYPDETIIKVYNEEDTLPAGTTVEYKLNYITIPLGLKLKTNQIGYFSYFARVGFTNQFNIKAKATTSDGSLYRDDIKKEIFFYNLAYHFGIGVEYAISEDTSILFGVNYHNGFINITRNKDVKVHSRVLSLRVGVIF
jgi:hypothetical protein